ncbi:MAG TPA: LysM peptidoglycan-binding domain-containing protein [Longimicrobium sp.]
MLRTLPFALLLGTAACASGRAAPAPAPAAPVPLPAQPVQAPEPIRESFELAGAPGKARANILGDVRYDLPVEANRWVEMELDFLVNQRRAVIGQWLSRADKYRDFVQEIFASYGIPRDLHHLAMVESGYSPTARSHAGAVGMWQFMSTTGRGMGLRIDDVVDERMDPVRSTHAAARHLRDLHRDFRGDWALAAAAYNAGSGRINRGLGRYNVTNFWDLAERGDLAQETRHYVPRLYAVTIIGRDPARFGYPAPANVLPRFRPDSVRVDIETPVAELAKIANLNASELATLNPHLVRGTAPAGYKVWTPAGSGAAIQTAFDTSAYRRSGGYAWYTLRRGEDVAQVAAAGGIPVERIRELNLSTALDRMGTGDRVRLPAPVARTLSARPAERQRLASVSDEPRGPSSPELDAARAEARRLRAARREEERAREAQREQEREAARIADRARAVRRAEEREAARAEERAASARRLAARAEADKDGEETPRRRASERDSAESKVAAADEPRPARRSTDSAAARRTSDGERVASRSASSDDERPSASRPRRSARADSSARTRRTSDGEDRPRTHTVERGETLRGLAEKYNVTVAQIRAANDIAAGKGVELGMRLRLPRAASSSASLAAASERAARTRSSDDDRPSTASRSSTSVRTGTSERRTTRSDSSTRRASSDEEAPRSRTASERRASSDDEAPRARSATERRDSSATRRTASAARDSASKSRSTSTRRDTSATRRTASTSRDSSASRTRTSRDSSASRSRSASARDSSASRSRGGSSVSGTRASSARSDSAATRSRGSSSETKPRFAERTEGSTRRASASETPRPSQHTVKSGETLFGIAREYGVTVPALREANDMDAGAALQPGQKLRIPRS